MKKNVVIYDTIIYKIIVGDKVMFLEECYKAFGGELESVKERILKDKNYAEAFRAARSLKGVCFKLGIQKLGETASIMTEYLRGKDSGQIDEAHCERLFQLVSSDYAIAVEAIKQLG